MRAIILAGGKGTRLKPYTTLIPKPLVPIGDKYSILEIIIMQLARNKFSHITITINHLSHLIQSYFGNGDRYGVKIDYSFEEKELSTIAPLKIIKDLPDNFLVMNGDILTDMNFYNFYEEHLTQNNSISVAAFKRSIKLDFGVMQYDSQKILTSFQEKPTLSYDVSMGIYCFNKSAIDKVPYDQAYGFDTLMLDCLRFSQKVNILPFDGYWLDIGRPDDYQDANDNFDALAKKLNLMV